MKFLLDESADFPLSVHLIGQGHDVTAIAHDYPRSLKDSEVLAIALKEQRVLIANDHDFGELVFRQGLCHSGVILFRLGAEDLSIKIAWLDHVLKNHEKDLGHFILINDRGVRVRRVR